MALHGGDPDELSFKTFLDISYTLLVEEYRTKAGMNLIAALEETKQYAAGASNTTPEEVSEDAVVRKNEQSLAQLDNMMKGVR